MDIYFPFDTMSRCPSCGNELKGGICLHCDSGNVFIKSDVSGGSQAKKNVIRDSIFVRSNVDLSTTINLYLDKEAEKSGFFQSLMRSLHIQPSFDENKRRNVWKLAVPSPDIGNKTLETLKETLRNEVQTLKIAHRKILAKIQVNENKKELLQEQIEKLRTTNPGSRELPHLENTVMAMEQYPEKAELLSREIDELTDHLHAVTAMQEEERFLKDAAQACGAVEKLLEDAVKVAAEAGAIVGGLE